MPINKEKRTERIEGRVKPSLNNKIEKAIEKGEYRTKSAVLEAALIKLFGK